MADLDRCFAANSGQSRAEVKSEFDRLRWQNPLSFDTYMKEVGDAGRKGYAVDEERYVKGVTTVSAPVLVGERAVMAISTVGFTAQFSRATLKQVAEDVRDPAREISATLAGSLPVIGAK